MKKIIFLVSILLVFTVSGCSLINAKPGKSGYVFSAIKNPQLMAHNTLKIYKPADWQELKKDMILYYLPPEALATDTLAEKIVVAVYEVPANSTTTLSGYMKEDFQLTQKNILPNIRIATSTDRVKLGPLPAREEKYEAAISGKKIYLDEIEARNGILLYKVQHYCAENYCSADGIFKEMIGSFEPISPNAAK
jgi:hypothetical protein